MNRTTLLLLLLMIVLAACTPFAAASPAATALPVTFTDTPSATSTLTSTPGSTATVTASPGVTLTAAPTLTPTITPTATITLTPTFAFPTVKVLTQAHCRYGPSTAYLHAADLYPGDTGQVRGRFPYSKWLRIQFDKLSYQCWVAPSVVEVTGDLSTVRYAEVNLQSIGSNRYGPPKNVQATRQGNKVTITWSRVKMTEDDDRGYFIEAWVCQNGAYLWWTVSFPDQYTTSYTVTDEPGCSNPSYGELYTVEKHGYSEPVRIPWVP